MKKLMALVAVALIGIAGAFAWSVGEIQGTWQDANWDANWTFSTATDGEGQIVLTRASTGETIYTFNAGNTANFETKATTDGFVLSFYCKDTERAYQFTKPLTLDANLKMFIDPDWTTEDYNVTITYQTAAAGLL
ncbi:MAG TPA: hypothetical protein DCQ43_03800 [Treponema sp.]|jgi:pterin-4a-carbinolamine dehydratase|nr:hypothetical protein [Treponema sp.]HBD68532.1 hypothetical protein [Treponema sp.]